MATTGIDHDTTSQAIAKVDNSLLGLLASPDVQAQLSKVATKHLTAEKLMRLVTGEVKKTPALAKCSVASVLRCVMEAARLGLEPGSSLGLIYFVSYGTECTPIIGYKGLLALMRRTGELKRIEAHPVHANDEFVCEFGTAPKLHHVPKFVGARGDIVAFYAVAQLTDGATQVEVMTVDEVNAIRDRSRAAKSGPWVTDYSRMGCKTVLRRISNYLPIATERADTLNHALRLDAEDFEQAVLPHQPPRKAPPTVRSALGLAPIEATTTPTDGGGHPDEDEAA